MNTNYKVVKLTNGDNIICETVEHIDETYIIKTPLRMEVVQDITSHGPIEALQLSAWISPFTENKYFEIKETHVIVITDASIGLTAYYKNIIERRNNFQLSSEFNDFVATDEGPSDEEMFEEDYDEVLKGLVNKDKSKYH
tara:strand:- start:897 stop:1316 length:420 start_codon:yes stop_codon:yes gene_type:complete